MAGFLEGTFIVRCPNGHDDQVENITHNHEDHANAIGQFVNRRRVTILTAPPVMAGLVTRLSAILGLPDSDIRRMVDRTPLWA